MISLRKQPPPPEPDPHGAADRGSTGGQGKGHPTPKRKEAQAAQKRPLVPTDRKQAARADKEKARQARARTQHAMLTGDERYLPPRDKGPIRRYVRDYIDARWNIGEFFLPVSLGIVLVVLVAGNRPAFALTAILALYVVVLVGVVDSIIVTRLLRKRVLVKFGQVPKGTLMYGAMRAFQIRRTRMPRPQVRRGEYPT